MAYLDMEDEALVALVSQGNQDAFTVLVSRHTDRFFRLAIRTLGNHADAEDVVQSAFIKFWQRPHQWRPEMSKFTTWFYQIVLNACRDLMRKQSIQERKHDTSNFEIGAMRDTAEIVQSQQNGLSQKMQLERAMRRLKPMQRDALNLVVYCELPQKEAADILGISVKALESQLFRAKSSLAAWLKLGQLSNKVGYG